MSNGNEDLYLDDVDDGRQSKKRVFSLWISDVHTMLHCQMLNKYYYQGWHVPYVRIFGTILSAVQFADTNTYRYEVDDGTGIITCIINHGWELDSVANNVIDGILSDESAERQLVQTRQLQLLNESNNRKHGAKERCLNWFQRQIRKKGAKLRSEIIQGDCICFTGTIRIYMGQREIKVTQINRISRLEDKIGLIVQYVDLYKSYTERANRQVEILNLV